MPMYKIREADIDQIGSSGIIVGMQDIRVDGDRVSFYSADSGILARTGIPYTAPVSAVLDSNGDPLAGRWLDYFLS